MKRHHMNMLSQPFTLLSLIFIPRASCWWAKINNMSYMFVEELQKEKEKYKVVNTELDATFAELTGF